MAFEWVPTTLGKFVRLQRGHDLTALNQRPGPYPVMGSAGQNGTHDHYIARGPGVVVGRSGASMGRVHFTGSDYWPHNTCLYVTDFLGNDPRFTFYFLSTLNLASYNSGSAQPSLNRNFVYSRPIVVPPPREQVEIARFLGSLDDRIDNLRATNATLEAFPQALFKSWFVDFDPVHAKAEGRAPAGMDAATAALFPSEFEDSELGPIPKGWRVDGLGSISKNIRVQAKPDELDPGTIYIGLEHMPRGSIALTDCGTADGLASNKFWYQRNDILFGKLRPYFHKVGVAAGRGVCSTDILVVRPVAEFWFGYATLQFSSNDVIAYATRLSNGAKMPRTNWHDLAKYHVALPPPGVAETFDNTVRPMITRIHANIANAATLAALRDTLLPRLISGKLRLPDVEQLVEDVA